MHRGEGEQDHRRDRSPRPRKDARQSARHAEREKPAGDAEPPGSVDTVAGNRLPGLESQVIQGRMRVAEEEVQR